MKDSIRRRTFCQPSRRHGENKPKFPGERQQAIDQMSIKFSIYGEEMRTKKVGWSGKTGRVYLPLDWLGKRVKIIRMD